MIKLDDQDYEITQWTKPLTLTVTVNLIESSSATLNRITDSKTKMSVQ